MTRTGTQATTWTIPPRAEGIVWHAALSRPYGEYLLPLNEIRSRNPELYRKHAAKYDGREHTMTQPVPPLHCTWSDVVFLSPVDPTPLFEAIRESGRRAPAMRFWTLDASHLDPARTCIRLMRRSTTGRWSEPATSDDFLPFTTGTLRAVSRVTDAALRRLRALDPDEPLLPWVDVPHVLYRGWISLSLFRDEDGAERRP